VMPFQKHTRIRSVPRWASTLPDLRGRQRITVRDAWFETPIDNDWIAAYRLVPGPQGEPLIGELRVFPNERIAGRPLGVWSAELLGSRVTLPDGGLSADVLRSIRLGDVRVAAPEFSQLSEIRDAYANRP